MKTFKYLILITIFAVACGGSQQKATDEKVEEITDNTLT